MQPQEETNTLSQEESNAQPITKTGEEPADTQPRMSNTGYSLWKNLVPPGSYLMLKLYRS